MALFDKPLFTFEMANNHQGSVEHGKKIIQEMKKVAEPYEDIFDFAFKFQYRDLDTFIHPAYKDRIWGLFGEKDTLAHFEPLFLKHYTHSFHFPGGHTPTADEVRTWYVPLIEKLLMP